MDFALRSEQNRERGQHRPLGYNHLAVQKWQPESRFLSFLPNMLYISQRPGVSCHVCCGGSASATRPSMFGKNRQLMSWSYNPTPATARPSPSAWYGYGPVHPLPLAVRIPRMTSPVKLWGWVHYYHLPMCRLDP